MLCRIFLLAFTAIIPADCNFTTYFDNVNIKVHRGDAAIQLSAADTVEYELNATEIGIFNQKVPILRSNAFKNLPQLQYIRLQDDGIQIVEKGAFINLTKLRSIHLDRNSIANVTNGVFQHLHITNLHLSGNSIRSIQINAFYNLTYLTLLDLSRNYITDLQIGIFNLTNNLRVLNLNYNKIVVVPDRFFEGPFQNLAYKEKSAIDLSWNRLSFVSPTTFYRVAYVQVLQLNGNNLTSLPMNLFKKLAIDELDIRDNHLHTLSDNILYNLKKRKTKVVHLSGNEWKCSFVTKYKKWVEENDVESDIIDCYESKERN